MNKILLRPVCFIVFLLVTATMANAQEKKGAMLTFAKQQEDIGIISTADLKPYELEISFENTGDEPLVISNVRGCCGTRISNYPKEPVMPGDEAKVTIEFRLAPRPHRIARNVSIMSNDPSGMKVFRIVGEVVAESDQGIFGSGLNTRTGPRVD